MVVHGAESYITRAPGVPARISFQSRQLAWSMGTRRQVTQKYWQVHQQAGLGGGDVGRYIKGSNGKTKISASTGHCSWTQRHLPLKGWRMRGAKNTHMCIYKVPLRVGWYVPPRGDASRTNMVNPYIARVIHVNIQLKSHGLSRWTTRTAVGLTLWEPMDDFCFCARYPEP